MEVYTLPSAVSVGNVPCGFCKMITQVRFSSEQERGTWGQTAHNLEELGIKVGPLGEVDDLGLDGLVGVAELVARV